MRTMERIADWIARKLSRKDRRADMLCGDCPRGANCGAAPSADCLTKLELRASGQTDLGSYNAAQSNIVRL